MQQQDIKRIEALPPSAAYRRIDFDNIEVVPGIVSKTYILIVSGTKPWVTMEVTLEPRIYIQQPEYWGIEVVGRQSGIGLPATAPYSVTLEITHVLGTKGIEVLGATRSEKKNVP